MGSDTNLNKKEFSKYKVRDLIMLNEINSKTRWPFKDLDNKLHQPFRVEIAITLMAIHITLLRKWVICNLFHFNGLAPY
jgi:hypothetical protein